MRKGGNAIDEESYLDVCDDQISGPRDIPTGE